MTKHFSPEDLPLADKDMVVMDPNMGLERQIVAGQRVPADLVEAYENAAGKAKAPAKSKAETAPAKDKAQSAPDTSK